MSLLPEPGPSSVIEERHRERMEEELAQDRRFETWLLVRGILILLVVAAIVVARLILDSAVS